MTFPKQKISEIDFSIAMPERRGPLPITNLPVNALTDDTDPTREIRALVEQLQMSAKDARAKLHVSEQEKMEMIAKLELSRIQSDELRAHFVEITSLIRERDEATKEAARFAKAVAESQTKIAEAERTALDAKRQCDVALQQAAAASKQRDEFKVRAESLNHASQDGSRSFTEVQRQLVSIRQARDASQAANADLSQKLLRTEETLEDLRMELESLQGKTRETASSAKQIEGLRKERDFAVSEGKRIAEELSKSRENETRLGEEKAAALARASDSIAELATALEQNDALRAERDHATAEQARLQQELSSGRLQPEQEAAMRAAESELSALRHERDTAEGRMQTLSREIIDLRNQLQDRSAVCDALQKTAQEAAEEGNTLRDQMERVRQEREAAHQMREESLSALLGAQKQIETVARDRDLARQQMTENTLALEAKIEAMQAQIAAYEQLATSEGGESACADISELVRLLEMRDFEKREVAGRLEQQRTQTIDLASQLHSAQDQIKTLSATLGEARLAAKRAGAVIPPPPLLSIVPKFDAADPLATPQVYEALDAMRRCSQSLKKSPGDLAVLKDLHAHIEIFTKAAEAGGLKAVYRLGEAFAGLALDLQQNPDLSDAFTLRTVNHTIEFLATLLMVKGLDQIKDPNQGVVYAVDDDVDAVRCLQLALETTGLNAVCVHDPVKALCDLPTSPCDMIFLDVGLPGMDGFELCTQIRSMAIHSSTPIVFLTGDSSSENRMHSSMSGGNEFVGKPFIVGDLTVKALTLFIKAQLHLA